MDQLVSMLVPLETLEGWPTAEDPGWLSPIGLMLGYPFIATVLIVAYVVVTSAREKRHLGNSIVEPEWLGGQPAAAAADAEHDPELEAATSSKMGAAREAGTLGDTTAQGPTGGASARW